MHVPFDNGAAAAEQNFLKLIGKRGDLTILPQNDGLALLREPKWADKIEVLPTPFTTQEFFLVFSKRYFQDKPTVAEAFWQAIGDLKNSREYRQAIGNLR
jgi:polar amino acid transport system substrate-binding protein